MTMEFTKMVAMLEAGADAYVRAGLLDRDEAVKLVLEAATKLAKPEPKKATIGFCFAQEGV